MEFAESLPYFAIIRLMFSEKALVTRYAPLKMGIYKKEYNSGRSVIILFITIPYRPFIHILY